MCNAFVEASLWEASQTYYQIVNYQEYILRGIKHLNKAQLYHSIDYVVFFKIGLSGGIGEH